MTTKTEPRNPIADLPRHVQGAMLRELLDGYTQVPTVYIVKTEPIRFIHLFPTHRSEAPSVRDITGVIEGIFGTPIKQSDIDAGFDLTDEIRGLFAYDVNFWPVS